MNMSWIKTALRYIGIIGEALPAAAEVAKDVAPAFGASAKTQADIEKAAAAAQAAAKLGEAATKASQ